MFPRTVQCPSTGGEGQAAGGTWPQRGVYCKKCMHFGEIDKNGSTNISTWTVNQPCTICAMANNGFWGWDSEENFGKKEHLIEQNGVLPGKCGIIDVFYENYSMNNRVASDEQIILGFVQYALYNHLKWEDLLKPGAVSERGMNARQDRLAKIDDKFAMMAFYAKDGPENSIVDYYTPQPEPTPPPIDTPDLTEEYYLLHSCLSPYQQKWSAFDTSEIEDDSEIDDIWYWWKMIPLHGGNSFRGISLPERFHQKLMLMIVNYPDKEHENCVPKTRQKVTGNGISDDVWTTFWNTFVEPAQVVHIFQQVFITTFERIISEQNSQYIDYSIYRISSQNELETIRSCIDENDYYWMLNRCRDFQTTKTFYLSNVSRHQSVSDDNSNNDLNVIRIFDRNIFGTYLTDVSYYDMVVNRSLYSESSFRPCLVRPYYLDNELCNDMKLLLWNVDTVMMFNGLLHDAECFIGFQKTNYWETAIMRLPDPQLYIYSDHSNEKLFKQTENSGFAPFDNLINYLDNGFIQHFPEIVMDKEKIIKKLKDLQIIIDEKVKENISDGVYLELVNQTYDIFKLIKG